MADATTPRTGNSRTFDFSKVAKCRIHPGIGIARVGNSPDEYFIGPEAPSDPQDVTIPSGGFKDAEGRVKRQAARFRIYAYDKEGNNLGELPIRGRDDLNTESRSAKAEVQWSVHLMNKKGAWYKFVSWEQHKEPEGRHRFVRNSDIPVPEGQPPDSRKELVIDPGIRHINGSSPVQNDHGTSGSSQFDTGTFRGTSVPLGELRVDQIGRLLVLGGLGKSASTKLDNPIGADPADHDFWANNDYWYDDVSDGPVTATVTLPVGADGKSRTISIDDPEQAAWVIVAPPKFAPGIYPIVTLYDVMREVAIEQKWIEDEPNVEFCRDIRHILLRAADTSWVNEEARRHHGFDKSGNFRKEPLPDDMPSRVFMHIRNPGADRDEAVNQATTFYMPPLSGDEGDRMEGEPTTWLSILPSQYRKIQRWSRGDSTPGRNETFPALENIADPAKQVFALQRAALEPCVGGAFFPGIEMTWIAREKDLYATAFRINSKTHGPGDITKYMCVPWQADLYDCKDTWWPAARPDDVIPEDVFEEANKAWRPGQLLLSEGLEGREKWDRGLGVTTLFRRPWQNPAAAADDPRDSERRGCDDMVRYWHELGFVVPRQTAWRGEDPGQREIVQVETQRRPYAGMDVRELFHCLLNLDQHRGCLPKVQEFVDNVLEAGRRLQLTADAFAFMDNIRPFKYAEETFEARIKDIYDDCADFAFTVDVGGVRRDYDVTDPDHNPYFRARENVIERIRQLTPFNFLDGAWLRNIHRVGPVDEVNSILFTILKEELGDGVPSQNHANIYRDLCHSFGFYPPPMESTAFARDPEFLDAAFDSPAFQLGISEFSNRYYPEIIGMSLWLEWTVLELHRIAAMVENVDLNSHFYRMHIAIDNAACGHGAEIVRAVKIYLRQIRTEGGEPAVQSHWRRIWDGYVAFAYTFVIIIQQVIRIIQEPPTLQQRLEWMIRKKRPFGEFNHHRLSLGNRPINEWFSDPTGFLNALKESGYIIPGDPDQSTFFKKLEFRGGPMYHVFSEDEIKLWRDWTLQLGEEQRIQSGRKALREQLKATSPDLARGLGDEDLDRLLALKNRLQIIAPDLAEELPTGQLLRWQQAAKDYRIALWLELAAHQPRSQTKKTPLRSERGPAKRQRLDNAIRSIDSRYRDWLASGMVRAVTHIAALHTTAFHGLEFRLLHPVTGQNLTIDQWFEQIRAAPTSTVPATAFLVSLEERLRKNSRLFSELFVGEKPLAFAFRAGIPGNDGCRAIRTLKAWIAADYPPPKGVPTGSVRALRIDSSHSEQERHPTGVTMGFGTVH
jgi:hypothetical protein